MKYLTQNQSEVLREQKIAEDSIVYRRLENLGYLEAQAQVFVDESGKIYERLQNLGYLE